MENLNFFYQDIGTSSSAFGHLTQEEAAKEALAIRMSQKCALLEEERHIIETMAYHDKYKKILDEVWKDNVELDGKIVKEEEEAVKRIKGEVGVTTFIAKFLILDIPIDHDSAIVVGRGFLHTIDGIINTPERFFLTFDGFCHQTFRAARSDVMRNAKSDNDYKEYYQIQRNKFRAPIYGPKPASYLKCNYPAERSLAIQTVTNPFRKISVWKKAVSFLGSLPVPLKHVNWKPDYKGSYSKEEEATRQWCTEIRLTDPYRNIYLQGFKTKKTDMKLSKYHKLSEIMSPNWFTMGTHDDEVGSSQSKRPRQHETVEGVLLPQVHYEFLIWEGCSRDAKFRMGCDEEIDDMLRIRLGLYEAVELEEEGFNVYFEGGLRSDEHFNAQDYWLSISLEENLGLSRSHTSTIRNLILRVIHKMITYGLCQRTTGYDKVQKNDLWLLSMFDVRHQNGYANVAWVIGRWMKRKGVETQKESQIFCGQFISNIARKCRVLTEDVVRSLSALIYCRDLDTITLRDLIDSEGKLIPKDPQPGVPRVGIPIPPRASMHDLYIRMVLEHMAGVYSVLQQGAYNPLGYAQPHYDQYYQQYPPPPPKYQQQQQDDDE
ncbi:hypothetical protein Tco_0621937 [Tanacetum coccineum]